MIPKLVRDKVPGKIRATGMVPVVRRLDPAAVGEVLDWLDAKLIEEVMEFMKSGDADELVDVVEVCLALWRASGRSPEGFIEQAQAKAAAAGLFEDLVVLEGVVAAGDVKPPGGLHG
jgi:predicted house-cleaning noncanonical NTP pyrophosphatase (MazG superfamily)